MDEKTKDEKYYARLGFAGDRARLLSLAVLFRLGKRRCVRALPDRAGAVQAARQDVPGERDPFLARSLQHLQDNIRRAGPAAAASYSLLGAILLLGGAGHLLDRWQQTEPWGLIGGLLLGLLVGFYELAKTVLKP